MKRKILSYLLVGLFASFIGGYCFMYVEAGEGQQDVYGTDSNGSDSNGSDSNGSSPAGSKGNGMAPAGEGGSAGGGNSTTTPPRQCGDPCDGIKLNTCFPIIKDCIETKAEGTNPTNAFPAMLGVLTKIIMSVILVVCFILIIVAGIMRAGAGEDSSKTKKAKELITKVAVTIILLGFSGVILKLVNPNFFY